VLTVCPYCGAGCQLYLVVENGQVVRTEAANGRTNEGNLCLKGYYGWDLALNRGSNIRPVEVGLLALYLRNVEALRWEMF